jgi:group I intron endonuclease
MENTIYIYSLTDPDTNEVRYIGKTVNIKRRYYEHTKKPNEIKSNSHKCNWIKKLIDKNKLPIINIIEECNDDNWEQRERYWISQFNNLTNGTDGGESGYITSPKVKEKLKLMNSGENNPCFGKIWTDDERKRLSEARKKVTLTDEWKSNIGKSLGFECEIDGIVYRSMKQASIIIGVSYSTIEHRIKSNNFPTYKLLNPQTK